MKTRQLKRTNQEGDYTPSEVDPSATSDHNATSHDSSSSSVLPAALEASVESSKKRRKVIPSASQALLSSMDGGNSSPNDESHPSGLRKRWGTELSTTASKVEVDLGSTSQQQSEERQQYTRELHGLQILAELRNPEGRKGRGGARNDDHNIFQSVLTVNDFDRVLCLCISEMAKQKSRCASASRTKILRLSQDRQHVWDRLSRQLPGAFNQDGTLWNGDVTDPVDEISQISTMEQSRNHYPNLDNLHRAIYLSEDNSTLGRISTLEQLTCTCGDQKYYNNRRNVDDESPGISDILSSLASLAT